MPKCRRKSCTPETPCYSHRRPTMPKYPADPFLQAVIPNLHQFGTRSAERRAVERARKTGVVTEYVADKVLAKLGRSIWEVYPT